ncbi:hypothetical protein M2281_001648 [Mesorhizobium soli]|jgi:hypothetical protein|uniref:hypothetical protein n=1 Tax=Pseudaminobacter soli (ex Li et al. 2025) TaxID=1295366 RepID=UPI002475EEF6|nr:hypothetical protein [Mesorhizobium soli]MDH6231076.1 hypothetical protein [Mesorhizobium soli]
MNNIILSFRDRESVRLAVRSAAPVARKHVRPAASAKAETHNTQLTCHWQRDQLTGRLEGRWSRESRTRSEEGVSRSFEYALAA